MCSYACRSACKKKTRALSQKLPTETLQKIAKRSVTSAAYGNCSPQKMPSVSAHALPSETLPKKLPGAPSHALPTETLRKNCQALRPMRCLPERFPNIAQHFVKERSRKRRSLRSMRCLKTRFLKIVECSVLCYAQHYSVLCLRAVDS